MILDPYETTITKPYKVAAIRAGVLLAALADRPYGSIYRITENHQEVPSFTQPFIFETPSSRGELVAIDCRQYKGSSPFVTEQLDLLEMRAALSLHAVKEKSAGAFFHPVAQVAYANIVAGVVSQKFGIDPKLKLYVTIVAAAHYYNITHGGDAGYSDTELPMIMQSIVRNLRLPMDTVSVVMDRVEYGDTMEAFCENVKRADGTENTKALSPGMLINGTSGMWFGINAAEMMGVCFEHAPTFCAMLFAALGDGSYSRGEWTKRLKYVNSVRQKADVFRKAMRSIQAEVVNA